MTRETIEELIVKSADTSVPLLSSSETLEEQLLYSENDVLEVLRAQRKLLQTPSRKQSGGPLYKSAITKP